MGEGTPPPSSTPQLSFIITEFDHQTSSPFTQLTMRLPCIPLFLAVAIRPVNVGAHIEASDIVTTTGESEVQRHLRVQERTHENDDDRGIFTIDEIKILKFLEDVMGSFDDMVLKSRLPDGASATTITSFNTRKRKADQMLDSETKKTDIETIVLNIQTKKASILNTISEYERTPFQVKLFVEWVKALEENATKKKGEEIISFADIIKHFKKHQRYTLMQRATMMFKENNWDPIEVFYLYQLNYAKDQLFKQWQLRYWVHFVDACNMGSSSKLLLIDTLLEFYNMNSLLAATGEVSRTNKFALRVENELMDSLYTNSKSPIDAFILLKLDRDEDALFASPEFYFWMKYCTYYNGQVHDEAKIQMCWVILLYSHWSLRDVLEKIKPSKFTEKLEEEAKTLQVDMWKAEDISVEEVNNIVAAEIAKKTKSVQKKVLKQAEVEYFAFKLNIK